jgi:hypothetical protein
MYYFKNFLILRVAILISYSINKDLRFDMVFCITHNVTIFIERRTLDWCECYIGQLIQIGDIWLYDPIVSEELSILSWNLLIPVYIYIVLLLIHSWLCFDHPVANDWFNRKKNYVIIYSFTEFSNIFDAPSFKEQIYFPIKW